MNSLALEVGDNGIAVARITDNDLPGLVVRVPTPPLDGWIVCRNLLLDVAGDDEITTIGIACSVPGSSTLDTPTSGSTEQWPAGSDLKNAVQRTFPAAAIYLAPYRTCVSLAESQNDGLPSEELALAGAGILALLAYKRRLVDILRRLEAGALEGSHTSPRACLHQTIRWRYQDPGYRW
ncbi:hypothetical protein ACH474_25130 [Nocardia rhamnosiphila]|jgi:hypothetical protein|uniref:Uncharacterized protein n=1 Tax=Nocardia rhamnosiphila TaxID=426716 RepID=A0ABV2WXP0_9NOCA|nr:hypothetical protein [Nocardia rhamnosiphila]